MRGPPQSSCLVLLLVVTVTAASAVAADGPRLVRIPLTSRAAVRPLLAAGLDVIEIEPSGSALVFEWPGDAERLARLGLAHELVDPDPGETAARRALDELLSLPRPPSTPVLSATGSDGVFRPALLPPFGFGSMGGNWTLDEIKMKLDQLVADDTNDLVADRLDTLGYSVEGRPIWGLKIGHGLATPGDRPFVYYSALTHAREPESMQALFYFLDDALTKYGIEARATELLDQRILYVVPCVNPDGYRYNQTTNPNGGGMWRKNRRGVAGVDINRNYGFEWGYDDIGSSPDSTSQFYRGPGPWSEPETIAQRDAITGLRPRTGFSVHTYANELLYPWAFTGEGPEITEPYDDWSQRLTEKTNYNYGNFNFILYPANGEFNDWAYGDTLTKPRVISWTPEIGNEGFWPPPTSIVPQAKLNLDSFYLVAEIARACVKVSSTSWSPTPRAGQAGRVRITAENVGMTTAGPGLTAMLEPLDSGVFVLNGPLAYPDLAPLHRATPPGTSNYFYVTAADTMTPGRAVRLACHFTTPGGMASTDTFSVKISTALAGVDVLSASTLELASPYPNPMLASTRIEYAIPAAGVTRLEILDLQGRHVATLVDRTLAAGRHDCSWALTDDAGRRVQAGIYFAVLASTGERRVRRLALLE